MKLLAAGRMPFREAEEARFREKGWEIVHQAVEKEALACDPAGVDAVICNWLFVYHDLARFTRLRMIQLLSAGHDRVPEAEIRRRGIRLCDARGVYSAPMAEFALGGVLQLFKRSRALWRHQAAREWQKERDLRELGGCTVCVVGTGSVGCCCARAFAALCRRVIGVDLYPRAQAPFAEVLPLQEMQRALRCADVLILTVPLTEETRGLIGARELALLPGGAVVVNIARGGILDEEALLAELRGGRLAGAVLDVFAEEPLPAASPLWGLENVILTPHNSFVSDGNDRRMWEVIRANFSL